MLRASGFYKSPPLSSEIPKLLLLCYSIVPINYSWWKYKTSPNAKLEKFLTQFGLCITETTKTKQSKLPGFNKFNYKLQARSFQQLDAYIKRTFPKSHFPDFSLTNVPLGSLFRIRANMEIGVKISEHLRRAEDCRRRRQEGSICYLFGIISKAEPAEDWHWVPCANAGEGSLFKGQVSGWLGAISRLTAQLNRGNFFKCNWTVAAPAGFYILFFSLGIPVILRPAHP